MATPSMEPRKEVMPFLVRPPTMKMMQAVSRVTTPSETSTGFMPFRNAGMRIFQMARAEKAKDKRALAPVQPPKASSRAAKSPKSKSSRPRR